MPDDRPERRRFTLTLRALMLLVLVAGVWMARQVNRAREQRAAVESIKRAVKKVVKENGHKIVADDETKETLRQTVKKTVKQAFKEAVEETAARVEGA